MNRETIYILYIDDQESNFGTLVNAFLNCKILGFDKTDSGINDGIFSFLISNDKYECAIKCVQDFEGAEVLISEQNICFDLIFIDYQLANEQNGVIVGELIHNLMESTHNSEAYQVMLTAFGERMIDALRVRLFRDFIHKDVLNNSETFKSFFKRFEKEFNKRLKLKEAEVSIRKAEARAKKAEKELAYFKINLSNYDDSKSELKGNSKAMRQIQMFIDIYGRTLSKMPVLLLGETGTGKEIIAREIHGKNPQYSVGTFYPINCAAIPENIVESTLFGHKKGAFTGAIADRKGAFEIAANGTLFLDEFGDLSPKAQNKILRVVEYGDYIPVGGEKANRINNVRIICATSKKILDKKDESIRKDLLYRLSGFFPEIPPLRERKEDIESILKNIKEIDIPTRIINYLVNVEYDWPGNVRELINFSKQAVMLLNSIGELNEEGISKALTLWKNRQPIDGFTNKLSNKPESINEESSNNDYDDYSKEEIYDVELFLTLVNLAAKTIQGKKIADNKLPDIMNKINLQEKIYYNKNTPKEDRFKQEISSNASSSIKGRFENHKDKITAIMNKKKDEFQDIFRTSAYQRIIATDRKK